MLTANVGHGQAAHFGQPAGNRVHSAYTGQAVVDGAEKVLVDELG